MIGFIMWYKTSDRIGLVWCEDQGPVAFIGANTLLPEDAVLQCGDQVDCTVSQRDGVRFVSAITTVKHGRGQARPHVLFRNYRKIKAQPDVKLRVI